MPYIDFQQLIELEADCVSTQAISWHSVGRSHAGRVRRVNEDAFYNSSARGLWAVADGMGGLARGDYASGVVAESFVHFVESKTIAENIRDLEIRLREAHSKCRHSFPGERVGSTVVALFHYGQYGFLLWAGDSRVYRLRGDQLEQMTADHTVAQERHARGDLTAAQAARHATAHVLTRAVGVHQTLHLDLDYEAVQPGDRFLLCSDGLYNDLGPEEIKERLQKPDAQEALDALIDRALDKGGRDNITAIIVDAS